MKRTEFACKREELTIRGTEYRREESKMPAVILSHEFMADQRSVSVYAEAFAKRGYAAYTFDFCGGGLGSKSDGKTTEMSVLTEKEDLKSVISYVKQLPYVDDSKLILLGASQGGLVSAMTAAELGSEIAKLILLYPALCIPDDARSGIMMMASFDPQNPPEEISCGEITLGKKYPLAVMDMKVYEEIQTFKGDVLILHGTADEIVDFSYSKKAVEEYEMARAGEKEQKECKLVLLDGAGHGFSESESQIAIDEILKFI